MKTFALFTLASLAAAKDPDAGRDMVELVTSKGFAVDEHYVTTDDGYILGMFNLPCSRSEVDPVTAACRPSTTVKPVVMLQHGLIDSSYTWVNNFADESLAFLLADAGYNVWLGNNRGNTWSMAHSTLKVDSDAFWDFSWDHMAAHDFPAMVQYVLSSTGVDKVSWVGHSEGTIQVFAGATLDENAWIKNHIDIFVALAPVTSVKNQKSFLFTALADLDAANLLALFGEREFVPHDNIIEKIIPGICTVTPGVCDVFIEVLCGPSHDTNKTRMEVYTYETPAGTSVRNMVHWSQGVKNSGFHFYDYGCGLLHCDNKDHYGQKDAPSYDLSKFSLPTALFWGDDDYLADPADVAWLLTQIPASTVVHNEEILGYAHMDFVWGEHANAKVYPQVIDVIAKAKNGTLY